MLLLLVAQARPTDEPDLYLLSFAWHSPLERYGVKAVYRGLPFNVSVSFIPYRMMYNVSLDVINAVVVRGDFKQMVRAGDVVELEATVKAPSNASIPLHTLQAVISYSILPDPSWACNRVEKTVNMTWTVAILCAYTNLSRPPNSIYIYTWPYGYKQVEVYRDGILVYNRTVYDWDSFKDDYVPKNFTVYRLEVKNWNLTVTLTVERAKQIRKSVEIPMSVYVLERDYNASKILVGIDFNNSMVCIANNATLEDKGMLVLINTTVYLYRFNPEKRGHEYWDLEHNETISYIWLGETECVNATWDLMKWPFLNATIVVTDDVHGNVSKWYVVPPLAPLPCDLCVRVLDELGDPLPGARVRIHGVVYTTDATGTVAFKHVEGVAIVSSGNASATVQLVCGECVNVTLDVNPPRTRFLDPYNGGIYVEAYDSHWVYLIVDGEYYGPFNGTFYIPVEPGVHRICVADMLGNKACLSVVVPPRFIEHMDDKTLFVVSLILVGLVLIVMRFLQI